MSPAAQQLAFSCFYGCIYNSDAVYMAKRIFIRRLILLCGLGGVVIFICLKGYNQLRFYFHGSCMHEFVIVKGLGSVRRLSCVHSLKMFDYRRTFNRRRYLWFMKRLSFAELSPFVFHLECMILFLPPNHTRKVLRLGLNPTYRGLLPSSALRKASAVRPPFPS